MPYTIKKIDNGFKVCKKDSDKCFSKRPLSHSKAISQLRAIETNTHSESDTLNEKKNFIIRKKGDGYKVCNRDTGKCRSRKSLKHFKAIKQLRDIEAKEHKKHLHKESINLQSLVKEELASLKPSAYSQSNDFVKYKDNPLPEDSGFEKSKIPLHRTHTAPNKHGSGSVIRELYFELIDERGNLEENVDVAKEIAIRFFRMNGKSSHIIPENLFRIINIIKESKDIKDFYRYLCSMLLKYENRPKFYRYHANPIKWFNRINSDILAKESSVKSLAVN